MRASLSRTFRGELDLPAVIEGGGLAVRGRYEKMASGLDAPEPLVPEVGGGAAVAADATEFAELSARMAGFCPAKSGGDLYGERHWAALLRLGISVRNSVVRMIGCDGYRMNIDRLYRAAAAGPLEKTVPLEMARAASGLRKGGEAELRWRGDVVSYVHGGGSLWRTLDPQPFPRWNVYWKDLSPPIAEVRDVGAAAHRIREIFPSGDPPVEGDDPLTISFAEGKMSVALPVGREPGEPREVCAASAPFRWRVVLNRQWFLAGLEEAPRGRLIRFRQMNASWDFSLFGFYMEDRRFWRHGMAPLDLKRRA